MLLKFMFLICGIAVCAAPAVAQDRPAESPDPAILLLMDSSKSMSKDAGGGTTRIAAAKAAVDKVVGGLPDDAQVGLRVYGSKVSGTTRRAGCRDTEQTAPVAAGGAADVIRGVKSLQPTGFTPIGRSLREAPDDFPADAERKTLILVSDGGDNCAPPDPCKVARDVAKQGIELTIQVIGLQVSDRAREQLKCIAEAGGGTYVDAEDPEALSDELGAAFSRARRVYEPTGTAIEGGLTPEQAAPVKPGQYVDDLVPGEKKYYAIEVARKQRLFVSGVPVVPGGLDGGGAFRVALSNPLGEEIDSNQDLFSARQTVDGTIDAETIRGEYVGVSGDDDYAKPGKYVVDVSLDEGNLTSISVPVELLFQVLGPNDPPRPVAGPAPESQSASAAAREPKEAAERTAGGGGEGGVSPLVLVLVGIATLAVGAIGAWWLAPRLGVGR